MQIFNNKTILIFGGTGSFGSAFLAKINKSNFKEIRIFSRDEKKQFDLRNMYQNNKIKFIIGDIRDREKLSNVSNKVDHVFHASALKQVPSCEFYPMEAVKTNIIGTNNILDTCLNNNVKSIVCLSTDKAVNPINAMGMSKALMEKIAISKSRNAKKSKIIVTRYGNVLMSRGSVIPHFINQIKNKKKITITNPEMTRFLMRLDDAINLVVYAIKHGNNGQIIVPKTPAAKILDLAKAVCKIYRYKFNPIIIGTRHGEKKHETLLSSEEKALCLEKKDYFIINYDNRDLNYDKYFSKGVKNLSDSREYTSNSNKLLNTNKIVDLIKSTS
jgi:UDP-N-acetylglucosamine 4,6-dehydratase